MDEVSWGSVFFRFPAAHGLHVLSQHAPDPWLQSLLDNADSEILWGLFTSCRAGAELALQAAPRCSIQLSVTAEGPQPLSAPWLVQALGERRLPQRTRISIKCKNSEELTPAFVNIPERLRAAGQAVTDLALPLSYPAAPASQFLQLAASVFPNLTTLAAPGCVFPTPAQLPNLQHLTVKNPAFAVEPDAVASTSRLLPQLTSYTHTSTWPDSHTDWAAILTRPRTLALTHFTTDNHLSDELAAILSQCPSLTHVRVGSVRLTEQSKNLEWGVRVLGIEPRRHDRIPELTDLANLPRIVVKDPEGVAQQGSGGLGRLGNVPAGQGWPMWETPEQEKWTIDVRDWKGLGVELIGRLPEVTWTFCRQDVPLYDGKKCEATLFLRPHPPHSLSAASSMHQPAERTGSYGAYSNTSDTTDTSEPTEPPPTLLSVLHKLRSLQSQGNIALTGLPWGPEQLMQVVTLPMPPQRPFGLTLSATLTDDLLADIARQRWRLSCLSVESLKLQSDEYANTPWPFEEISVYRFNIPTLLKLPDPRGVNGPRMVRCAELSLGAVSAQMDTKALIQRLKHMKFTKRSEEEGITICLRSLSMTKPEITLQIQVDLVQYVQIDTPLKYNLAYYGAVTPETIKVLSALQPTGYLDLYDCTWPCDIRVYEQLAAQLPTSYTGWLAYNGRDLKDAYEARRLAMGLPPLDEYARWGPQYVRARKA